MNRLFHFPNPINEYAARWVAGMVSALALAFLITGSPWLLIAIGYGFLARVATGPTLSPVGLLVVNVIIPLFHNPQKPVPGPPKRFAQAVGLVFSSLAMIALFGGGSLVVARYIVSVLTLFAAMEAFLGFCAGCFVFGHLMRWGIIPVSVCEACVVNPHSISSNQRMS